MTAKAPEQKGIVFRLIWNLRKVDKGQQNSITMFKQIFDESETLVTKCASVSPRSKFAIRLHVPFRSAHPAQAERNLWLIEVVSAL